MDVNGDTTEDTASSPSEKGKNTLSTAKAKMCSTIHAALSEFKQSADKQSTDETQLRFIATAFKGAALGFQAAVSHFAYCAGDKAWKSWIQQEVNEVYSQIRSYLDTLEHHKDVRDGILTTVMQHVVQTLPMSLQNNGKNRRHTTEGGCAHDWTLAHA
jgi:hypothetical protein